MCTWMSLKDSTVTRSPVCGTTSSTPSPIRQRGGPPSMACQCFEGPPVEQLVSLGTHPLSFDLACGDHAETRWSLARAIANAG